MAISQPGNPGGNQGGTQTANEQRSEGLLPAGQEDGGSDDGRFEVAEEVNLDQQSDQLRHVGQAAQLPQGGGADNPDRAADDKLPDPGAQSDG